MLDLQTQRCHFVILALVLGGGLAACGAGSGGEAAGDRGAGDLATGSAEAPSRIGVGATFTGLPDAPRSSASSEFWGHWGDGRAELDSYRAVVPRYGEPRQAELVLIYVTEPHDRRRWIKDDGAEPPDRIEVMKLNSSLKFLTGIYPYSVMTSVFSPVDDWGVERFQPVKVGHSAQEWCGHYLHEVWPGRGVQRSVRLSYFPSDGERLDRTTVPEGTLYEDGLLIQLRELDGSFAGGGSWEGWIVPSLWNVRRGVAEAEPVRATIRREPVESSGASGSGGVEATRFTLSYGEYERVYEVEAAAPRRILGWTTSVGDTVRIARTRRLAYWSRNDPEGRSLRRELGLDPDASGIPPVSAGSGTMGIGERDRRGASVGGSGRGGGARIRGLREEPAC